MKKALFLSFYWPPSGKASLHWPLKMIKHIKEYGWNSSVLTVNEDSFSDNDDSLLKDIDPKLKVVRSNFFDPFNIYKKILGKDSSKSLVASESISKSNKGFAHRLSLWIRMNLFVPDARIGWYFPGVKAGLKLLKEEKYDVIVSNGPPHSTHLIGMKLSKTTGIPLVSVLIDPWVDIAYYKNQKRNKITVKIDNRFERKVMEHSSKVILVTENTRSYFIEKYPFLKNKTDILYWGYNESDFTGINIPSNPKEEVLLHAGNIFDFQNPVYLWKTIKKLNDAGRKIKIKFVGTVSPEIKNSISNEGLLLQTEYLGFLPYNKVIDELSKATYLLVCATEPRHLPGKLYEYLRVRKPILAFAENHSEIKKIIEESASGMVFSYRDSAEKFFKTEIKVNEKLDSVIKYDRKNIAQQLAKILNSL